MQKQYLGKTILVISAFLFALIGILERQAISYSMDLGNLSKKPTSTRSTLLGTLLQKSFHDTGRPPEEQRTSGGGRDSCKGLLVALTPGLDEINLDQISQCNSNSLSELALTSIEKPILWFYIPEGYAFATSGSLVLLNDNRQAEYRQPVELPGQSGIVGIQLEQPLEAGHTYRWLFEIRASARRSENPFVEGLIQQELPSEELASQLNTASELEQVQLYLNASLWHDALTQLIEIHQMGVNTLEWQSVWRSTLESEGLESLSEMPITDCCIPDPLPVTPEL